MQVRLISITYPTLEARGNNSPLTIGYLGSVSRVTRRVGKVSKVSRVGVYLGSEMKWKGKERLNGEIEWRD